MSGLVVDASVAVKWLVDEPGSDQAGRLLDQDLVLHAPELLYVEAGNALWALARRRIISHQEADEAIKLLTDAPLITNHHLKDLLPAAFSLADDLDHPIYDCCYLALALHLRYPLMTADSQFHQKVHKHAYLSGNTVLLEV